MRPLSCANEGFRLGGFNALMGLSCYTFLQIHQFSRICFNALMGLSCYDAENVKVTIAFLFQCPHGLELLRQECPIFKIFHDTFYASLLFIGVY